MTTKFTPSQDAFEAGKKNAKMIITFDNQYEGDWANGSTGQTNYPDVLFELVESVPLSNVLTFTEQRRASGIFSCLGRGVH